MNEAEIEKIVSKTVAETLLKLGIDADDPLEFQADMQHLRSWRRSVDTVKKQSLMTAIGILTAGMLGLIWVAVRGPG
jgi:hypothetical protein